MPLPTSPAATLLTAVTATVVLVGLSACTGPDAGSSAPVASSTVPAAATPQLTAAPTGSPTATAARSTGTATSATSTSPASRSPAPVPVTEPTTTNTLPAPPAPSRPAPSTAGPLTAAALPVPAGWRTVVRKGGAEEGYLGNGGWVHARDPRYAAHDVITLGCAEITRDDYPDPRSALEGTYTRGGQPGIGLVLDFSSATTATRFFTAYRRQVAACTAADGPLLATIVPSPAGLVDRRTYPDGDWTEAAVRHGSRVTLVILADPGHRIPPAQAERLVAQAAAR